MSERNQRRPGAWMLVALAALMLACGGPAERKAAYTAKAEQYLKEGNFPKARVALRNVLKIDPRDVEAYFLFAQVEEREQNWRNAFGNYLKVVELDATHRGALIKLGKYYLEARAFDKAAETADKLLAARPNDTAGDALKAAVAAMKGDLPGATAQAEAIIGRDPTDADAAILLATLYVAQGRAPEGEPVLRRAVEAHPHDIALLTNLGTLLARLGDTTGAERTFRQLVETEPAVFEHRARLAEFYESAKASEKAEATLREAVRLAPDAEVRRLALASFLAARRSFEQGEAALLEARRDLPHSMKIRFALGRLYEGSREAAKARKVYDEIVAEQGIKPPGLEAQVKLAGLDLAEGKRGEAEGRVALVLKDNPRATDALMLQGRMALERREGKEAVQAFRTVLKDQPDSAEGHVWLGQAYLQINEPALARESLEKAVALDPRQYGARRALAGLDAAEGRRKEARLRLEALLKDEPKDLGALGLLFDLEIADRDWNLGETTLSRLREAGANQALTDLAEGNLHQGRREWEQARAAYERAAAALPDHPAPLVALMRLELARGRPAEAKARLEAVLAKRPDHPFAHGTMGELLLAQGDEAGAEREFREATRLAKRWLTPWVDWATMKLGKRRFDEAIGILREGLGANPKAEELRMLLATTLGETKRFDEAIAEYEVILKDNPGSVVAANNLASLLTDQKGDRPSLERALALSRDFEKTAANPLFLDTLGWVYVKLGQSDEGVRVIRQAVAKEPDHPVLNYHLGIAYHKAGNVRDAKTHLEKAVRAGKPFAGLEDAKSVLASLKS